MCPLQAHTDVIISSSANSVSGRLLLGTIQIFGHTNTLLTTLLSMKWSKGGVANCRSQDNEVGIAADDTDQSTLSFCFRCERNLQWGPESGMVKVEQTQWWVQSDRTHRGYYAFCGRKVKENVANEIFKQIYFLMQWLI